MFRHILETSNSLQTNGREMWWQTQGNTNFHMGKQVFSAKGCSSTVEEAKDSSKTKVTSNDVKDIILVEIIQCLFSESNFLSISTHSSIRIHDILLKDHPKKKWQQNNTIGNNFHRKFYGMGAMGFYLMILK